MEERSDHLEMAIALLLMALLMALHFWMVLIGPAIRRRRALRRLHKATHWQRQDLN